MPATGSIHASIVAAVWRGQLSSRIIVMCRQIPWAIPSIGCRTLAPIGVSGDAARDRTRCGYDNLRKHLIPPDTAHPPDTALGTLGTIGGVSVGV